MDHVRSRLASGGGVRLTAFILMIGLVPSSLFANFTRGGPQPGDVYKEYSVSMLRSNWRVTDPDVDTERHAEASRYLPNEILSLKVDDLEGAVKAEIIIDFWEGHDGTQDKKFRFNDKSWIPVPEPVGIRYMQQLNHLIEIPLSHLREGTNYLEGTCDRNNWNWGQWGWYGVVLRVYYESSKPHATGEITSHASNSQFGENPVLTASTSDDATRVDFLAYYDDYDKDGDSVFKGWQRDYHRASWSNEIQIRNHVGTDKTAPFASTWKTGWVPDQPAGAIKFVARVMDRNGYWYVTPVVDGLTLSRPDSSVRLYKPYSVSERYWVRNNQTRQSKVSIPTLKDAVAAKMQVSTWNGDDNSDEFYVTLNNSLLPKFGKTHFYSNDEVPLSLSDLKVGENVFTFHSDTIHHGIEILMPGPAICVRYGAPLPEVPESEEDPTEPTGGDDSGSTPVPEEEPEFDIVSNGDFEKGNLYWKFYTSGSGNFEVASPGYDGSSQAACIQTDTKGNNIQLWQEGIELSANWDYKLTFAAYSNSGNDLKVTIAKEGAPYTNYGLNKEPVDLGTGWKLYTIYFKTRNFTSKVFDARLFFWLADDARPGDRFYIDAVSIQELEDGEEPPAEGEGTQTEEPVEEKDTTDEGPEGDEGDGEQSDSGSVGASVLANGDFENGMDAWRFYTNGSGRAEPVSPGQGDSATAMQVRLDTSGSNIQLWQEGIELDPNTEYELSFCAYSTSGRDLRVTIAKHGKPYTNYGLNKERAYLDFAWQEYSFKFTTTNFGAPVFDARLYFWFADDARGGDRYFIDKVSLAKVTADSDSSSGEAQEEDPAQDETQDDETGDEPSQEAGPELVLNGGFDLSKESWRFYTNGRGGMDVVSPGYESTGSAAQIAIDRQGSNTQLYQEGIELKPDTEYLLGFAAFSSTARNMEVSLLKHGSPYTNYGLNQQSVELGTGWSEFTFTFKTINFNRTVFDGRLLFWFADDAWSGDRYFIDEISLVELIDQEPPTVPTNLVVTRVSANQIRLDWNASEDNASLVGYIVYRNGVDVADSVDTSIVLEGDFDAADAFTVTAFDVAGNESGPSNTATVE